MSLGMALSDLPQEILDQIIDQVADSDTCDPRQTLDALKCCALVSRAFNSRARRHIFSTVNLILDRSVHERAGRLLQVLRNESDNGTPAIQHVHGLNLLFDFRNSDIVPSFLILSGMAQPFIKIRNAFNRSLEAIGLRERNIHQVLDIFNDTTLTHFGLGSRHSLVKWSPERREIDNKLLRIMAKPELRSIHIHNLTGLHDIYIKTAFQSPSLTDIKLAFLLSPHREPLPSPQSDGQSTHAKVENMELRFISYRTLLEIIRALESPQSGSPAPHRLPIYSRMFSRVQTLSVCIPRTPGEQDALWDIMQSAATSLTTLKVESHGPIDFLTPSMVPITLSPFKCLKRLDFKSTMFREDTDIGIPELYLTHFLSSATSPIPIESINITFTMAPGSRGNFNAILRPNVGWTTLDNALNNALFVNLKSVVVHLEAVIDNYGIRPITDSGVYVQETSELLPIMTASSTVKTRVHLDVVKDAQIVLQGYHFNYTLRI